LAHSRLLIQLQVPELVLPRLLVLGLLPLVLQLVLALLLFFHHKLLTIMRLIMLELLKMHIISSYTPELF
jgi:hypothetical protein